VTRLASIAIGTNTTRLLIAEVEQGSIKQILQRDEVMTGVGKGLSETGEISNEAVQGCIGVMQDYQAQAQKLNARVTAVVATSAIRDSRNRESFLHTIRQSTGLDVEVISGDEEAHRVFLGVASHYAVNTRDRLAITDIGGGSTEVIVESRQTGDIVKASVNIGSRRMTETFLENDPPTQRQIERMTRHIQSEIQAGLASFVEPTEQLIGVGGTVTTLAKIHLRRSGFATTALEGHELVPAFIETLLSDLAGLSQAERERIPGLPAERASVILAGTAILNNVVKVFQAVSVIVTEHGVLEGSLLAALHLKPKKL